MDSASAGPSGDRRSSQALAVDRLKGIVTALRVSGLMLTLVGILMLLSMLLTVAITPTIADPSSLNQPASVRSRAQTVVTSSMFVAAAGLFTLVLALRHDALRRSGDAIFSELSDEMQLRRVARDVGRDRESPDPERNRFEIRLLLREYTHASDLPLLPGRYGPLVWCAIALFVLLTLLWIARPAFIVASLN
jgi:hypothetical protein